MALVSDLPIWPFGRPDKGFQVDWDANISQLLQGPCTGIYSTTIQAGISLGMGSANEWVIKFNGLSRTADSYVHVVHISCVITACTLKSLSSLT